MKNSTNAARKTNNRQVLTNAADSGIMNEPEEIMNNDDRRSRKTIKTIQDTLLRLLAFKTLSEIKIVEFCQLADINRTTFYLHFDNIEEVAISIRDTIIERIFEQNTEESFLYTLEHPLKFLNACTEVISSYEGFENFVRRSPEASYFLDKMKNAFSERAYAEYMYQNPEKDGRAYYVINFMAAGTFDAYIAWLRSDKSIPLSSIFDACADMFAAGHTALSKI